MAVLVVLWVRRMLNAGPGGFEGGTSAKKYVTFPKASKATATRDSAKHVETGSLTSGRWRSQHLLCSKHLNAYILLIIPAARTFSRHPIIHPFTSGF